MTNYMPILKGKAAEYRALGDLAPEVKRRLTPLIELVSPDEEERVDEYLGKFDVYIEGNWGNSGRIYIDAAAVAGLKDSGAQGAAEAIFSAARRRMVVPVPVTGLNRSEEFQEIVRATVQREGQGACVRIAGDDFQDADALASSLPDFVQSLGLSPGAVDLLLDFGALATQQAGPVVLAMASLLENLPLIERWRSVYVSGTSFPRTVGGLDRDAVTRVPRTEWKIWRILRGRRLPRIPEFSDYAIAHPELVDFKGPVMDVSAALRYTTDSDWLIVKGRGIRRSDEGSAQMYALCRKLSGMPEYSGRDFSEGDLWISERAQRRGSPGNPERWRRVGTSHHLTFVVRQLASLPEL